MDLLEGDCPVMLSSQLDTKRGSSATLSPAGRGFPSAIAEPRQERNFLKVPAPQFDPLARQMDADISALLAINTQLTHAKALIATALRALSGISDSLVQSRRLLERIGDTRISTSERECYISAYKRLVSHVADAVDGSSFRGQSLLGSATGPVPGTARSIIHDEDGATSLLSAEDCSTLPHALATLIGSSFARTPSGADSFGAMRSDTAQSSAKLALDAMSGPDAFATAQVSIADRLVRVGSEARFLDTTIAFNHGKIDRLNGGWGVLVDTDLSKEAARLRALHIRQQLSRETLPLATQAPATLQSLFA